MPYSDCCFCTHPPQCTLGRRCPVLPASLLLSFFPSFVSFLLSLLLSLFLLVPLFFLFLFFILLNLIFNLILPLSQVVRSCRCRPRRPFLGLHVTRCNLLISRPFVRLSVLFLSPFSSLLRLVTLSLFYPSVLSQFQIFETLRLVWSLLKPWDINKPRRSLLGSWGCYLALH